MTVRELLERIDSAELTEWQAFFKISPFGAFVDDYRSALLCAIIANSNSKKKFKPEDFMLTPKRTARPDPMAQLAWAENLVRMTGGTDTRQKKHG